MDETGYAVYRYMVIKTGFNYPFENCESGIYRGWSITFNNGISISITGIIYKAI